MSNNSSPPTQTPTTTPSLHTYHCLCATLLLCTSYSIPNLPIRAAPSRDKARILPLPPLHRRSSPPPVTKPGDPAADAVEDEYEEGGDGEEAEAEEEEEEEEEEGADGDDGRGYLPSLILPALRPARKIILVRREDGWERRRVWRCGRCGLGVGYEVEEEGGESKSKRTRVMFLLEGGLVETGDWDGKDGGLEEGV